MSVAAAVDLGVLPDLLGYALRRAQLANFQAFHRAFAAADIRPAQFSVLVVLHRNPGLRQSQVAAALGIKRTNFVVLFDSLEHRGLARRDSAPSDRRASALYLTHAGQTLLRRLQRIAVAHDRRFAVRVGEDGRRQLLALLWKLGEPADRNRA